MPKNHVIEVRLVSGTSDYFYFGEDLKRAETQYGKCQRFMEAGAQPLFLTGEDQSGNRWMASYGVNSGVTGITMFEEDSAEEAEEPSISEAIDRITKHGLEILKHYGDIAPGDGFVAIDLGDLAPLKPGDYSVKVNPKPETAGSVGSPEYKAEQRAENRTATEILDKIRDAADKETDAILRARVSIGKKAEAALERRAAERKLQAPPAPCIVCGEHH